MSLQFILYLSLNLLFLIWIIASGKLEKFSISSELNDFKIRPFRRFFRLCLILQLLPIAITFFLIVFPVLYLSQYIENKSLLRRKNKEVNNEVNSDKYLPYYDKLFFHLYGGYNDESPLFHNFLSVFQTRDYIAFPVIFDKKLAQTSIYDLRYRKYLEKSGVALFFFDVDTKIDKAFNNNLPESFLLSDTNFSYKPKDIEINYTTLAHLLGIPIDGINKLVLVDKKNLKKLLVYPIESITNVSISDLIESDLAKPVQLENSVVQFVSEYLSLKWEYSELPENEDLKKCGMLIRQELYKRCKAEAPELINFFKLVENRSRRSKYRAQASVIQRRPPEDMEGQAYEGDDDKDSSNMLREPRSEYNVSQPPHVHSPAPTYGHWRSKASLATEQSIQTQQVQSSPRDNFASTQIVDEVLTEILTNDHFDFESRMFLKSANMVYSMLYDSMEELDYSSIVIGYAKFFEKEINLSIVQYLRSELGIEMPLYFNQYFETSNEFIIRLRDDFVVNFNLVDRKTKKYLAPGLGNALNCIKTRIDASSIHSQIFSKLYYQGKRLNDIRNRTAHPEFISKDEVIATRQIITDLYVNQVFIELLKLKAALRGDKN